MTADTSTDIVWGGSFRRWLGSLGPTALLASMAMGPSTIGSVVTSGATLGYQIAWLLILAIAWKVVVLYMIGKTTCITGLSVIDQYARYFHRGVALLVGVLMLVTILPVMAFTGVVLGHAMVFLVPVISEGMALVICFFTIAYLYVLRGGFQWIKTVCTVVVTFMTLAFFANAWVVAPDLSGLLEGVFAPSLPAGREGILLVTGVLGSTISIITVIFLGYAVRAADWGVKDIPVMAWDVVVFSGVLLGIFSLAIYVSGTALYGRPVGQAVEVAIALEPVAGPLAKWIFAVGFFTAVFTTIAAGSYLPGYICHDFFKWELTGDLHEDLRFRVITLATLATIFLAPLVSHLFPPIMLVVFAGALFNVSTPPVLLLSLILGLRRDVMGEHRIGWPVAVMVAGLLGFSTWSAYVFVVRVLPGMG